MIKGTTNKNEKFHKVALNIWREIYDFVINIFFSAVREKSTLAKGPFSALVKHTDIINYYYNYYLLLLFTTVCL